MTTGNATKVVRVGTAVRVLDAQRRILLGYRKSAHEAGTWSLPGGAVEFGETPMVAAVREVREETGLEVVAIRGYGMKPWVNTSFANGSQWVTLYFEAKVTGTPRVMEPDKCERWEWFDQDDLPSPLFAGGPWVQGSEEALVEGPSVEGPSVEGPSVEGPSVEGPSVEGLAADILRKLATEITTRPHIEVFSVDDPPRAVSDWLEARANELDASTLLTADQIAKVFKQVRREVLDGGPDLETAGGPGAGMDSRKEMLVLFLDMRGSYREFPVKVFEELIAAWWFIDFYNAEQPGSLWNMDSETMWPIRDRSTPAVNAWLGDLSAEKGRRAKHREIREHFRKREGTHAEICVRGDDGGLVIWVGSELMMKVFNFARKLNHPSIARTVLLDGQGGGYPHTRWPSGSPVRRPG